MCADVDSDNQIMSSTIPFSLYYPYLSFPSSHPHLLTLLIPTLTSSHPPHPPPTLPPSPPPTLPTLPPSPPPLLPSSHPHLLTLPSSPPSPPHPPTLPPSHTYSPSSHPPTLTQFSGFYIMGFCLVVLGIFIYNLKHPVEKKFKERTEEERRERSIERLFSVATTKVC